AETRERTAALREVVEPAMSCKVGSRPRTAISESSPRGQSAWALDETSGASISAFGILRDMRELDKARAYAESLIKNAPDPVFVKIRRASSRESVQAARIGLPCGTDNGLENRTGRRTPT